MIGLQDGLREEAKNNMKLNLIVGIATLLVIATFIFIITNTVFKVNQTYADLKLANVKLNYLLLHPAKDIYVSGDEYYKNLNDFLKRSK